MPIVLSEETYERHEAAADAVLGGPQNSPLRPPLVPVGPPAPQRAVLVTGAATSDRYPCKLQWRNEGAPQWSDFTPSITGWAISYDGSTLEEDGRYDGTMVSVHPSDGLPIWACETGGGSGRFVKALVSTPASNLYDARVQIETADGSLSDTGAAVWMREANVAGRLVTGEVYWCKRSGYANGRPVYTGADFNLTTRKKDGSSAAARNIYLEFGPNEKVTVSQPGTRQALVEYSFLDVYDLHTNQLWTNVWTLFFDSVPSAYDPSWGDYVFVWDEGSRSLIIRLNGFTGNQDWLTRCVSGILKKRNMDVRNGSIKVLGPEQDA